MVIEKAERPVNTWAHADGYLIIEAKNNAKRTKMLEVSLKVFKGEKMLVASNRELGIFTEGRNWNVLMKNIREVIEGLF